MTSLLEKLETKKKSDTPTSDWSTTLIFEGICIGIATSVEEIYLLCLARDNFEFIFMAFGS